MLPGKMGLVSLTLRPNKTSFTPRHTITGKGVAYIKPLDSRLPLRPIEIEFENNCCCIKIHNTSDTTVEFLHSQEMAYLDARSKGLVQTNNLKHFPIDQYLHDRMTPATLSPMPLAYGKPIQVVLVKWKIHNLYRVCSDFCILNEKIVKINHAFPLVRDCIEQLGRKKCHYLSTIDLLCRSIVVSHRTMDRPHTTTYAWV